MRVHAQVATHLADAHLGRVAQVKVLHDGALPVAVVADATEIGEWLLRGPRLLLNAGEEVAEVDQEPAVPLALVLGHGHDTGDVILLLA